MIHAYSERYDASATTVYIFLFSTCSTIVDLHLPLRLEATIHYHHHFTRNIREVARIYDADSADG
jgi:hypothetical protein